MGFVVLGSSAVIAQAPVPVDCQTTSKACLQEWADYYAEIWNINKDTFFKTIQGESGWSENPKGWNDGGRAYGILQFHQGTFDSFSKLCNIPGEYKNPIDQLDIGACAFSLGLQSHWTAYRNIHGTK